MTDVGARKLVKRPRMEGNAWLHDEHYPSWHGEPRWRPADPRWDVAQTNMAAHLAALPSRTDGAGANATDIQRHGLMASYVSAFLAEEELQSLANPPHVRARFPLALAAMLGGPGREAGVGLRPAKL